MRLRLSIALLAAALPLIIFAITMIVVVNRQQQRAVEDMLRQATSAAMRAVDERMLVARSALEMLATSRALTREDEAGFTDHAQRALRQRLDWIALERRDRNGTVRVYLREDLSLGWPVEASPRGGEAAAAFRSGEPRTSGILTDPRGGHEPAVAVSVPVFGRDGVTHVLTAYVRAWAINRALRNQGIAPNWVLGVIDADQKFIARTMSDDPLDRQLGMPAPPSAIEGLRGGEPLFFSQTVQGDRVLTASATSAATGWTVLLAAPAAAVEGPTRRTGLAVAGGGAVALLLTAWIGWAFSRSYSEREKAQRQVLALEAAASAERRSTAILESITDGVFELDPDWRITYINGRARHLIARGRDLTGQILWEAFPEAVGTAFWNHYKRAMHERTPVEFEEFYPALGRWYAVRAFPSPDGLSVYFRDVTAHKAAEAALRSSELRYRTLVDALPQMVWTCLPDGSCDFLSRQWMAYTGRPEEQNLGYGWTEVIHPDDRERLTAQWLDSVISHKPFDTETRIRRADGVYRWFKQRAVPLTDPAGGVDRWFGTSTDITDMIEARDASRAAREKAEQAALSKSKFLASASHDLRQPMQSLFLFSGALHGHVQGEKGRTALAHLERGLDVMKSLLDSLLDVSRLDAGVVQPAMEDFPASVLLDHIAAGYAQVAKGKGLEWRMSSCPWNIRSDRILLGRMIRNLIENAIRYTESGAVEIDCQAEGDRLAIEVRDTGVGIPADQLPHIFEEFHQVGNPERDRSQGLGLGLAIVQRIGRLLDHPVSVRSEPGRGSCFRVEVPLGRKRPPVERAPSMDEAAEGAGVTLASRGEERFAVVVDDDAIVLLGLQAMLKEWGYEVLIAASGAQAIEKLKMVNRMPDIVIADYRLRDGEVGTSVILAIRALFAADIPGIIVTGETGPECQRDATAHGFGLMHKPVTPRQLGSAMERHLATAG